MLLFLVFQLVGYGLENIYESIDNIHKLKGGRNHCCSREKIGNFPYESDGRQEIVVGKCFPFGTSGRFHPRVEKEFRQVMKCFHEKVKRGA
jgi:hypothetical protein